MLLPLVETAFTYDERPVAIVQVVLAAVSWEAWAHLLRRVELGVVAAARLEREREPLSDEELRPRLVAWRRERRLLAADDYNAWLTVRELTLEDMSAYLRRATASERLGGDLEGVEPKAHAHILDSVAAAAFPEAILSGELQSWAERLGRQAAAARALARRGLEAGEARPQAVEALLSKARADPRTGLAEVPAERLAVWAADEVALECAWDRVAREVADEGLIKRCVRSHHLDWQRLAWDEATFTREDVALEAAMWVRDESVALDAIAERAGTLAIAGEAYGFDAGELTQLLVGTRPGDLIGPLATAQGWRLLHLRERVPPSSADPQLRARAIAELLEDELAPHLAGRLEWNAAL
jgi:hypothetical protein